MLAEDLLGVFFVQPGIEYEYPKTGLLAWPNRPQKTIQARKLCGHPKQANEITDSG